MRGDGPHKIPQGLAEYAVCLGSERVKMTRKQYAGKEAKERPGTRTSKVFGVMRSDLYTDTLGILGELIVRHTADVDPRVKTYGVATFCHDHPEDDADIICSGVPINVKACEGTLKANKRATDTGDTEWLYFVLLAGSEYTIYRIKRSEVRKWPVRQGYSPYYEWNPNRLRLTIDAEDNRCASASRECITGAGTGISASGRTESPESTASGPSPKQQPNASSGISATDILTGAGIPSGVASTMTEQFGLVPADSLKNSPGADGASSTATT